MARRESIRERKFWDWVVANRWLVTIMVLLVLGLTSWTGFRAVDKARAQDYLAEAQQRSQAAEANAAKLAERAAQARRAAGQDSAALAEAVRLEAAAGAAKYAATESAKKVADVEASVEAGKRQPLPFGTMASLLLFGCLVGWFLDIFTGDATPGKVQQMVTFCYIFPFAIFAGILVPLFAYPVALPDPPKPIGIILGCNDRPIAPSDKPLVPENIACYNNSDQWLVNIGGSAAYLSDEARRQGQANVEAAERIKRQAEALARDRAKSDDRTAGNAAAELDAKGKAAGSIQSRPSAQAGGDQAAQVRTEAAAQAGAEQDKANTKSAAVSFAAQVQKDAEKTGPFAISDQFRVTGGLVVPLYFVMLAIFGGFVSMLRRVPEIQERLSTDAVDRLTPERAREKLVFEVLQLLAAPLIAVTAYYLVDPASRASSIALAFIAGFSSETVLMYVRALTEKLQPETSRRAPPVEVMPTSVDFKEQAVNATSPPHIVNLTNRTASVLSGTLTATGDFACVPTGAFSVPAGSTFAFNVTFTPASAGKKRGQLQIVDNGPGSPRIVNLQGDGVALQPGSDSREAGG